MLRALLGALLVVAAWLWVAVLYLLQLEARHRLSGSLGESSPLRLALLALPAVVLVSLLCLVLALSLRRRNTEQDVRRALLTAAALALAAVAVLAVVPTSPAALCELVLLPTG